MENSPPILLLPIELLVKIIEKCPRMEWPSLELVDKKFRDAVLLACESVRMVDIERDFIYSKLKAIEDENDHDHEMANGRLLRQIAQKTESILKKLSERSPFITSVSGLSLIRYDPTLNTTVVRYLSGFEHLETIKFNAKYFLGRTADDQEFRFWCSFPLINFVQFIETTQSRATVKEIIIEECGITNDPIIAANFDQRVRVAFANNPNDPTRQLLMLKSFSMRNNFERNYPYFEGNYPFRFFDAIDASNMTKLSLGDLLVEPAALTTLINGAPNLQHLDFAFLRRCDVYDKTNGCQGGRLQPNKQLLTALGSRQQLSSLGVGRIRDGDDGCACHRFEQEIKNMLRTIAPRLMNLVFKPSILPPDIRMDDIREIIQRHMPQLKSITLGEWCAENPEQLRGIADGKELEEIEIAIDPLNNCNDNYTRILNEVMSTIITKSPRLKRFNVNYYVDQRVAADLCKLTDLIDLQFRADQLTKENFVAFSQQAFAKKLEILRLGSIGAGMEHGFLEFVGKATQLRELVVKRNVTSRLLECLAMSCPNLEKFIAWHALPGITIEDVQTLVSRCPKLRLLGVTSTDGSVGCSLKKNLKLDRYRKLEFEF